MNAVTLFEKNYADKEIVVVSKFKAPLSVIWDAFTNTQTLEKWWAPKPYIAKTKEIDFKEGGRWLYYMLSPKGKKTWSLAEFKSIVPGKSFVALDAFSDENGNIDPKFASMTWTNTFSEENGVTTVINSLAFERKADMKEILKMGFEDGYRKGLGQLQELL